VQARPIAPAAVTISRDQAQAARISRTAPVAPQRASIAGPPQTTVTPPAAAANRQVVVRSAPPLAPAPFAAKQAALVQHPGQPVNDHRESDPRVRAVAAARPAPESTWSLRLLTERCAI
jgi:hypothetical protein